MDDINLLILISAALLGSLGHCPGMCGGIVVAYSSKKISHEDTFRFQTIAHILYGMGRVTTYVMIGVVSGLLGNIIAFTPTAKGALFLITGILMVLAGLSLLGNLRFLSSVEHSISRWRWFGKAFHKLMSSKSLFSFYFLGLLNGMIPCGLVYSFAIVAASTASAFWGGVVMGIFGLATIPIMFMLGTATRFLQKGRARSVMLKLSAILVLLYGLLLVYKGYRFVRYPDEMSTMMEKMYQAPDLKYGKCGGMKCAPGKCG